MFELLAATGVRRSELLAFEVRHLALDGDRPARQGAPARAPPTRHRPRSRPAEIPARAQRLADPARGRRPAAPARRGPWRARARVPLDRRHDPRPGQPRRARSSRRRAQRPAPSGRASTRSRRPRRVAAVRGGEERRAGAALARPPLSASLPPLDTYVHLLDNDLGEPLAPLGRPSVSQDRSGRVKKKSSERPETPANGAPLVVAETSD